MSNSSNVRAVIVAHSHWDRAWYLSFHKFRHRLVLMIDRLLDLLESDPSYRSFVLDGQTILIDDYLEVKPENEARLRTLINNGRLVIGPWYVLPDLFLESGESIIRNLHLGLRTAEAFGHALPVGYVPDPFGHIAQLPQILQGLDLDTFIFMRGLPDSLHKEKQLAFNWKAPNGSSVLAYCIRDGYFNASSLGHPSIFGRFDGHAPKREKAVETIGEAIARTAGWHPDDLILLNNGMDHMPEQPELPEILEWLREDLPDTAIEQGDFTTFMEQLKSKPVKASYEGDLIGNPDHPILLSVYSTRSYLKKQNHRAESALVRVAEPLSALVRSLVTAWSDPSSLLLHAWKRLLQNHPHDDICGCSADGVHEDNEVRFREVSEISDSVTTQLVETLMMKGFAEIQTRAEGRHRDLFVFNPHPFEVSQEIIAQVMFPNVKGEEDELLPERRLKAFDADGREIELAVLGSQAPVLKAEFTQYTWGRLYEIRLPVQLKALGYHVVRVVETEELISESASSVPSASAQPSSGTLTGGRFRLEWTSESYHLSHNSTGLRFDNPFALEYVRDKGDTYSFSRADARVWHSRVASVAPHPTLADHIQVTLSLSIPLSLESEELSEMPVTMDLGMTPEGAATLRIKYTNIARNGRLRVCMPVGFHADETFADGHFRIAEHARVEEVNPAERPERYAAYPGELPYPTHFQQDFCYVSDGRSLVWAANQGQHEYQLVGSGENTVLAITLHRAVGHLSVSNGSIRRPHAGPKIETPGAQCLREHEVVLGYGISRVDEAEVRLLDGAEEQPGGTGTKADTAGTGAKAHLLDSLIAQQAKAISHPVSVKEFPVLSGAPTSGPLPRSLNFLSFDHPSLRLSSLRYRASDNVTILRVYNPTSEKITSLMKHKFKGYRICESDLKEDWTSHMEQKVQQETMSIDVSPYQIRTFLFKA